MNVCPRVAPAGLLTQPLPCYVTVASYSTFLRLSAINCKTHMIISAGLCRLPGKIHGEAARTAVCSKCSMKVRNHYSCYFQDKEEEERDTKRCFSAVQRVRLSRPETGTISRRGGSHCMQEEDRPLFLPVHAVPPTSDILPSPILLNPTTPGPARTTLELCPFSGLPTTPPPCRLLWNLIMCSPDQLPAK